MDADKLNEEAEKYFKEESVFRPPCLCIGFVLDAFHEGANYLMKQPLADRLTNEEKEKIKAKFNELKSLNSITNDMFVDDTAILEWLFGKELFNEK